MTTAMTTMKTTTMTVLRRGEFVFRSPFWRFYCYLRAPRSTTPRFTRIVSVLALILNRGGGLNECFKIRFKHCERTRSDRSQSHLNRKRVVDTTFRCEILWHRVYYSSRGCPLGILYIYIYLYVYIYKFCWQKSIYFSKWIQFKIKKKWHVVIKKIKKIHLTINL